MIKCLNCGEENPEINKYCEKCGSPLNTNGNNPNQNIYESENNYQQNKYNDLSGFLVILFVLYALVALFGFIPTRYSGFYFEQFIFNNINSVASILTQGGCLIILYKIYKKI